MRVAPNLDHFICISGIYAAIDLRSRFNSYEPQPDTTRRFFKLERRFIMSFPPTPVCAVVGVGPGNGAAFARRFAAEGYAVALLARTTGLTSRLAKELPLVRAYACDVGDPRREAY